MDRQRCEDGSPPANRVEALLVEQDLVTEAQLVRARRIAARLDNRTTVADVLVELGQLARHEHERIRKLHRAKLDIPAILHEDGVLDDDQLADVRRRAAGRESIKDRELLVESGVVPEDAFLRALSDKHDIPFVEPEIALVEDDLLARVSLPYLVRNRVLPIRVLDGRLNVVFEDPLDGDLIGELERMFGAPVQPYVSTRAKILEALRTLERMRAGEDAGDAVTTLQYREIDGGDDDGEVGAEAVQLVDYLLSRAIDLGASDVHVEPRSKQVHVRVRIDGVLHGLTDLPVDFAPRIVARIKILAGADIAERRLHQDGRIFVKKDGREIDCRVSTYASMYGETVVLRLLDRSKGLLPLDALGFEGRVMAALRDVVLRASSGLTLITGPTGSGKTTTMYSFVEYLLADDVKVISCEDPVEYVLEDMVQCSVNQKTGPTFADSLRAMLRQDPDVIVVGEIRDRTTASLALEASLTGHKVLSTFHTEDAVSAVTRLLELGVEPFLVSSTLSCVVAQRLARAVCAPCATAGAPGRDDLRYLSLAREDLVALEPLRARGCETCAGSGYRGRLGIHEVLIPDDEFRDGVLRRAPARELRGIARRLPEFFTLQEDGLLKVAAGRTTLTEIADNVPRDPDARPVRQLRELASRRSA